MALSRKLLFAAFALVPVAIACNGLIGLNDFEYGECPGAVCGDAGFDVVTDSPIDNPDVLRPDAAFEAAPGAGPVSWAQWPITNYDGGPGIPPSYTADAMTVKDNITNLTWQRAPLPSTYSLAEATDACKQLANGPWRVPKRIELVTLLDFTQPFAKIAPAFNVSLQVLWTSSEVRPFDGNNPGYWIVDFNTGEVRALPNAGAPNVKLTALCVKGS